MAHVETSSTMDVKNRRAQTDIRSTSFLIIRAISQTDTHNQIFKILHRLNAARQQHIHLNTAYKNTHKTPTVDTSINERKLSKTCKSTNAVQYESTVLLTERNNITFQTPDTNRKPYHARDQNYSELKKVRRNQY
jgi:hypothetical protein